MKDEPARPKLCLLCGKPSERFFAGECEECRVREHRAVEKTWELINKKHMEINSKSFIVEIQIPHNESLENILSAITKFDVDFYEKRKSGMLKIELTPKLDQDTSVILPKTIRMTGCGRCPDGKPGCLVCHPMSVTSTLRVKDTVIED
jgi:hypothetical protein